MKLQIKRW